MNKDNRINAITKSISKQRLQRFLSDSDDDFEKALELYEKNMRVSVEIFPIIACFEICLRNYIHEAMQKNYGVGWLIGKKTPLEKEERDKIAAAEERLHKENKMNGTISENMGRLVADLSLGFWIGLLGVKYEKSLWRVTLRPAFQNYKGHLPLKKLRSRVKAIGRLRNRIAHHEPIVFIDNIAGRHTEIIETIGWMCLDTGNWVGRLRPLQLG